MIEAAYSFTIPSTEDDTTLECRLYHPEDLLPTLAVRGHEPDGLKGAVIAHPYAPLGGCYDDPVVLRITSGLVSQGFVVTTFNFRGAGGSQGSTSWSGKGEKDDYMSVVGVLLHYLRALTQQETEVSDVHTGLCPLSIVLAGYSYGSLILSKLPPLETMTKRFETAALGSSAAEVILRARRLALETTHTAEELNARHVPRGRPDALLAEASPSRSRAHSSTVTVGGEETDASERHLSSREHHAIDLVKRSVEVPHRIKMRLHNRSSSSSRSGQDSRQSSQEVIHPAPTSGIKLRYLLISPVLAPLAHALVPPSHVSHLFGHHKDVRDSSTGFGGLSCPTLAIWGGQDGFTSAKKLRSWIDRLEGVAPGIIDGTCIETAGHFWREHGVMKELIQHITTWVS